jgi:adenosylmethionine-8-amino-7-oxononanoate aminotransferase
MMRESLANNTVVGDIRGRGLFMGVELVKDRATKEPFLAAEKANNVLENISLEEGVVIYPCTGSAKGGIDGIHFILFPPYIMTDAETEELVTRLAKICRRFEGWYMSKGHRNA